MMKSNETIIKMMKELEKMMKTMSPLMMEALGELDDDETEMMEMVRSSMRLTKLSNEYVDAFIEESEETNRRMKRIEEKLDKIIKESGDTNKYVHRTNNVVYDIKEATDVIKKRTTAE